MLALIMAAKIQENTGLSGTFSLENPNQIDLRKNKTKHFICLHKELTS